MTTKLGEMVNGKLAQWETTSAVHFCQIMQRGGTYQKVQYPTGLVKMQATDGKETAEIYLPTCRRIRKSNWTVICD